MNAADAEIGRAADWGEQLTGPEARSADC